MTPKSSMMRGRCICYAPTTGPIYQELLHSSSQCDKDRERNRPSSGLARVAAHPRPPKKRQPSASGTRFYGLVVFAMRILCRCGFRPTGPLWYYTSCNTRRIAIELPTHLGWTRRRLRLILKSIFFLLLAARVRSSCEEGPGQSALQSA